MQSQSLKNGARMSSTNPTLRTAGQSVGADTQKSRQIRHGQWGTSKDINVSLPRWTLPTRLRGTIHESEAGETEEGAIGVGFSEDEA